MRIPEPEHGPAQRERILAALVGVFLIGSVAWLVARGMHRPRVDVPVPQDLQKLDVDLREFLAGKIRWALENPSNYERQAELGIAYAANALWPEAKAAFGNASQLKRDDPMARLYLGVAEEELGNLNAAAARYREVTREFPKFAPGFYRLGDVLLRQGEVSEAAPAFEQLVQLMPKEWRGFAGLGEAALRRGKFAEATRFLEKAVNLEPHAKIAHHLLGLAYRGLGRKADAELELRLGLNAVHFPMPDPWSNLAASQMRLLQDQLDMGVDLIQQGESKRAITVLEKLRQRHPDQESILENLAIAYDRAGETAQAEQLIQKLIQREPRKYLPHVLWSDIQLERGEYLAALREADQAISLAPDLAQGYLAKATVLVNMRQPTNALAAFENALRCDPQNMRILVEIGDVWGRDLKDLAKARSHYERAVKGDVALVEGWIRLAEISIRQGDLATAQEAIAMIQKIAPDHPNLPELAQRLRKSAQK